MMKVATEMQMILYSYYYNSVFSIEIEACIWFLGILDLCIQMHMIFMTKS